MSRVLDPARRPPHRWIAAERASDVEVTQAVADPVFAPARDEPGGSRLLAASAVRALAGRRSCWLFYSGIGIWGINTTVVWGFAIANYVWWIGIGNAGTLISSMLLLTRQQLARLDQPLRRGDDAVRGRHRRHHADHPSRPADLRSTGSRPIRIRWRSGRSGAARWSGISGRSSAICCFRSCSGTSA